MCVLVGDLCFSTKHFQRKAPRLACYSSSVRHTVDLVANAGRGTAGVPRALLIVALWLLAWSPKQVGAELSGKLDQTEPERIAETLRTIELGQTAILERLQMIDGVINRTLARVRSDLLLATTMNVGLEELNTRVEASKLMAQETNLSAKLANASLNSTANLTEVMRVAQNKTNASIAKVNATLAEVSDIAMMVAQVQENSRMLHDVSPRMKRIALRLSMVEARLQGGNVSEVVEDITKRSMTDVLQDMNRALYRIMPSAI
eukprot:CAMPEP_0203916500 /NCGR_PEP_ID=MMETSP0359-20131031/57214_1 /ASSEMBLY_ACC=CAM_ASM_000338 /TAXON_ID=268821 /ORGANISM="Scrippsiella Hangoei, Strain SHTV-5" /LENGTH=260 /DNA_ID=CAMNT_0050843219 /DNA_START=47 /DNA_END=829 /DNA_ORIENTATION=+